MAAIYDWFLHNFADSVVIETSFDTDIVMSATKLAEERRGLIEAPYRSIEFTWNCVDIYEAERMTMALARAADQRVYLPLYPEQTLVTAALSATKVSCDTTNRNFAVGKYVVLYWQPAPGNRMTIMEKHKIAAFDAVSVTFAEAITHTPVFIPQTMFLVPLILAEKAIDTEIVYINDTACIVKETFFEVQEFATIPACQVNLNYVPYTSYPTLTLETNWVDNVKTRINRVGTKFKRGRAELVFVQSPKNQFEYEFKFLFDTRAQAFAFSKFFASRSGRLLPFYVVAPNALWEHLGMTTTTMFVTAPPNGHVEDVVDFVSMVGFVLKDGTVYVRPITAVDVVGATWKFTWTDPLPGGVTIDKIRRFTRANLMRFVSDALSEEWLTGEIMRCTVSTRDVVAEEVAKVGQALDPNKPILFVNRVPAPPGSVDIGLHNYICVQKIGGFDSVPSDPVSVTNIGGFQTNFVYVPATAPPGCTETRFFRSKIGAPSVYYHVMTLGPSPVGFYDSALDAALGAVGPP